MDIEFDSGKNESNIVKHGLSFADIRDLQWDTALYRIDERREYGEQRLVAYVMKKKRLHIVCLTLRGSVMRILSYRKANKREERYYAEATVER